MYRNLHKFCIVTRQFRTRAGRQSIGLGSSRAEQIGLDEKITDLDKAQKLWEKTYDRLAAFQRGRLINRDLQQQNYASQTNFDIGNQKSYSQISSSGLSGGDRGSGYAPQDMPISQQTKMNSSLNKSATPPSTFALDDQKILRLSFSEGYFYGSEGKKKPRFRFLKLFHETLLFVFAATLIYIVIYGENPFRRLRIGIPTNEVQPGEIGVSFADVKGCNESKQDLADVVEYLKKPEKFSRLGGKLPKGVLLVGPPGTGKTLMARAVAGEAGVPFLHASGSEFDGMFVGQGSVRVKDLFEKAKKNTPCVIFIDEIDSVGGKRSTSELHPYANQTINQLLSEMDGFSQNEGIIVLGATNRPSVLDEALLRPGRFDVQVRVPVPDYDGRKELFDHYLGKVNASMDIDVDMLCRTTIGFAGADVENLVNQGALKSATENMNIVTQEALEFARDKILMGPERQNRPPDKEQHLMTAYHESGHALVSHYTKKAHTLHKVTILSRNESLGHTLCMPDRDIYLQTKEQLAASIDVALGGRVAEELIYGTDRVTTGCGSDLVEANRLATKMVKDFGMSEKIGMRVFRQDDERSGQANARSELVESEISRLLEESKERVRVILTTHHNELKLLAEALMEYETLDGAEVKLVIEGKDPKTLRQEREKERRSRLLKITTPYDRLPINLLK